MTTAGPVLREAQRRLAARADAGVIVDYPRPIG